MVARALQAVSTQLSTAPQKKTLYGPLPKRINIENTPKRPHWRETNGNLNKFSFVCAQGVFINSLNIRLKFAASAENRVRA